LEKAVFKLDYGQLKLVFHALEERKQVIDMHHTYAMLYLA
jgi:glycerol-3-phosphate dehydrogenase